jgi:hypothetical protein
MLYVGTPFGLSKYHRGKIGNNTLLQYISGPCTKLMYRSNILYTNLTLLPTIERGHHTLSQTSKQQLVKECQCYCTVHEVHLGIGDVLLE